MIYLDFITLLVVGNWSEVISQLTITTNNDVTEDVVERLTSSVDWIRGVFVSYVEMEGLAEAQWPLVYSITVSGNTIGPVLDSVASTENSTSTIISSLNQTDNEELFRDVFHKEVFQWLK